MPDTFQALGVLVLALLPGALYVWSFERLVGAWGIGFSDRALRFVGVSAVLHALAAPVTYRLYLTYVGSGRLLGGQADVAVWVASLVYVGCPIALGSLVGVGTLRRWRWAAYIT